MQDPPCPRHGALEKLSSLCRMLTPTRSFSYFTFQLKHHLLRESPLIHQVTEPWTPGRGGRPGDGEESHPAPTLPSPHRRAEHPALVSPAARLGILPSTAGICTRQPAQGSGSGLGPGVRPEPTQVCPIASRAAAARPRTEHGGCVGVHTQGPATDPGSEAPKPRWQRPVSTGLLAPPSGGQSLEPRGAQRGLPGPTAGKRLPQGQGDGA